MKRSLYRLWRFLRLRAPWFIIAQELRILRREVWQWFRGRFW